MKRSFKSMICNTLAVSETEVSLIDPEYENSNDYPYDKLKEVLYKLGLDTTQHFELSEVLQHRNRLNQIVTSGRYIGVERLDKEWINSGYASRFAVDKSKDSQLLDDIYRSRGLTVDAQTAMEYKDQYKDDVTNEGEYS